MFRKKTVVAGIAAVALLLGLLWSWLLYRGVRRIPNIDGAVAIQAEPGMRIFIGERFMGSGRVQFSLGELLGEEDQESPATELALVDNGLTPEILGVPGAKALKTTSSGSGSAGDLSATTEEWLLRRTDGTVDQVFGIVLDWNPPREKQRRLLLPLRLRAPASDPATYIVEAGGGFTSRRGPRFLKLFGKSPQEWTVNLQFKSGPPPREVAEEYKAKAIWEPWDGQGHKPYSSDEERLQGTWAMISFEKDGRQEKDVAKGRVIIKGAKLALGAEGEAGDSFTFRLSPHETPKEIDFRTAAEPKAPTLGIYKLEGDSLTLCLRGRGGRNKDGTPADAVELTRPKSFSSEGGNLLLVLKRKKA